MRPSFKSILNQTNDASELFFCIRPCWEIRLTNYEFISYDFEAGQILTRDVKIKCNELQFIPYWSLKSLFPGARTKNAMNEQMLRWQQDLDARLKGKEIPPRYWEFPELQKGNIHKHCAHCYDIDCAKGNDLFSSYDQMACTIMKCRQVTNRN